MRLILTLLFVLLTYPAVAMGPSKPPCGGPDDPCLLDSGRSYHIKLPDGWDGTSPLPVMLHFHGWARTGALPIRHQRISGATRKRGVLLVAPNGLGRSWNFWSSDTDDVPFAAAVLDDVARRFPVDATRLYVSGYSYGSAMAWRYVCENGNGVAALLAVSGTLDQLEYCDQGPRQVRHVHGLNDTVMDFPLGTDGDTTWPVALWRAQYGCGAGQSVGPWNARDFLTFERTLWEDCEDGRAVRLDVHPGGHFIPHGWIGRQLDELLGLTPSYP